MINPNNCETCKYKHIRGPDDDLGQHCYMFADSPVEQCMQHTPPEMIDYIGLISPEPVTPIQCEMYTRLARRMGFR